MVQVTVGGGRQLQGTEANVVESLVVHHKDLIGVLHKLMEGQHGVVGLNNGVRHLQFKLVRNGIDIVIHKLIHSELI